MEKSNWFTVEQWMKEEDKWAHLFGCDDELAARRICDVFQESFSNNKYRVKAWQPIEYKRVTTNEYEYNSNEEV